MEKYNREVIKQVINRNFTFADLSPRFKGVDSSTGNIFCPFHDNHETPAAKMYWNDEEEMWVLHCFGECHRSYTAFDYVERILCEKYQKYISPFHFLKLRMPEGQLGMQLELYKKYVDEWMATTIDEKRAYIDNLFVEKGNIIDFIEELYTA